MNRLYAILLVFAFQYTHAQTASTFNYVDVNAAALSVPMSYTGGNFLNAYNLSVLDLSHRLSDVFNLGEVNKEYYLNESIKATKVYYTKDNVRMMILQPVYENAQKRCILLTNGNGENFSWSMSNLAAVDYALRGYVVAYYENVGSVATRFDKKGNNVNYFINKVINQCNGIGYTSGKDKFFTSMFINYFLSNAARKYMVDNYKAYTVDTTRFFMVGGSLGGNASLFFTYANANNLTHPLFNCVKDRLGYNQPLNNKGIVCAGVEGGGLPGPDQGLGNIIDQQDKTPAILLCGALDWVVNPNKTTILGPENWGALALKSQFDGNNIRNAVYVNAYGTHVFQTPSFKDNWNSLPGIRKNFDEKLSAEKVDAYAKANLLNLLMYQYQGTQMHEANKMIASYFDNAVRNTLPASAVTYLQPKCIQNTTFYQYSVGQLSIKDAANCYTMNNCGSKINRQLDKTTTTCLDGTFEPYSKAVTEVTIIPSNFNAPGKGLVKLANFLEILNQLNKKK
ncbi:MAG: hypothetical protein U0X41_09375 [Chitinophagales bacterium]